MKFSRMLSQKNILFIGDPYCIHNLKWITYFAKHNRCICIGSVNDYSNKVEHTDAVIQQNQIRVYEKPLPEFSVKRYLRTKRALKRLDKIIEENNIDFVHVMYATNIPWAKNIKKPVVLTTRGSDILIDLPYFFKGYNGWLWNSIYSKIIKKMEFITSTSVQQAERLKTLFPFYPNEKLHVIRTGVNVDEIDELGKKNNLIRDQKRILLARYVSPKYNNELILSAIQLLPEETRKELTLVMISPIKHDQHYFDSTMKFAHGLGCKIELKPEMSQQEMWKEFFKAGLCIMTPISDGTPNTAFEALAAKCPLIIPPLPYDKGLFEGVTIQLKAYDKNELYGYISQHLKGELKINLDEGFERVKKEGNRFDQMVKLNLLYEKTSNYVGEITCTNCVLSTSDDPSMTFDAEGVCNHCNSFKADFPKIVLTGGKGELRWGKKVEEIKLAGKNKKYDCIIGVSGGTDSTYLALKAKESGLRLLCVHLDNGWNSKEASSNIKNIIRKLEVDLYTHVIDWEEFRDIQLSYFKAGVIDLDIPTDHAILACLYQQAIKHKIGYILNGFNFATESVLPKNFNFDKGDAQNLLNIHKNFGTIPIKTFPLFKQKQKYLVSHYYKLKTVLPLNWIRFDKTEAQKEISEKLGWKDYGTKHYENIFTRFYQGYILPRRFGLDKRKAHLSSLICSGQMTREVAIDELKKPIYNQEQLEIDKKFVLNKFNWTEAEFEKYMTMPIVLHVEYGVEKPWSHYFGVQYLRGKK